MTFGENQVPSGARRLLTATERSELRTALASSADPVVIELRDLL